MTQTEQQIAALAAQGVSLKDAEAFLGHAFDEAETAAYRKAATVRRLKRAQEAKAEKARKRAEAERREKEALARQLAGTAWPDGARELARESRPLTATERSRLFRERGRELPPIPPPRHRRLREACRLDLLRFGLAFCTGEYEGMQPLLRRPPSPRMLRFVHALQDKILHGGLKHIRWPRGKGKSTWVKIAVLWATLYSHKRFVVVTEKIKGMAKVVVEEIWKRIYLSPAISADFPEFAIPMRDVAFAPQRMRSQTYKGKPTFMRQDVSQFFFYKLPTVAGYPNTGAIIAYRGADQALRGINIESSRPDFFFIDDPQTDEDAKNAATIEKIEKNITGAVLGSGKTDERISAVMASTPIEPDDLSEKFADPKLHPEWETETERFVVSWGDESFRDAYISKLEAAAACPPQDAERKAELQREAADFYVTHRSGIEAGAEMMDDSDFDPATEVSAYQHALWLLHIMKPQKFASEYQMLPTRAQGLYRISPSLVASRVNGCPYGTVPAVCTRGALAFVDVNVKAGLRWEIVAFGKGRVAATLAYGQFPAPGVRLIPEGVPSSAIPEYLAPALRTVASTILGASFVSESGAPVKVSGICFDGGWQTETVATVAAELQAAGVKAVWSKGFDAKAYSRRHHEIAAKPQSGLVAAEECHTWESTNGLFIAFNSDYWKEVSQTSFLRSPLQPSSSSFYGSSPFTHFHFAQEVCNERLKARDDSTKYGTVYLWSHDGPNHYGDTHAGALCYGAICSFFDPLVSVVSPELLKRIARRRQYVVKGL